MKKTVKKKATKKAKTTMGVTTRTLMIPDEMRRLARKYKRIDPDVSYYMKLAARDVDAVAKYHQQTVAEDVLWCEWLYSLTDREDDR
jgi:hypothetical protein